MNSLKLAVIGLGYVGLPLSSLLAMSYDVVGFDTDKSKIDALLAGEVPIKEPDLDEHLKNAVSSGKLKVTNDPSFIRGADVKIITVGTPYNEKTDFIDYSQLEGSIEIILPYLKKNDTVLLKSTVPPGTTMGMVRRRIESAGFKVPDDVGLVFSPERMIEGQALHDFKNLPKIIGASDDRSYHTVSDILNKLGGKIIRVSNPETAETVKMVDNYSRFVFLGLVNELALACEKIGVDVLEVIRSAKEDYPRNAGLLLPGPGVGGSCLNKDPFILRGVLRTSGMDLEMVRSAESINSRMPGHVAEMVNLFLKSGRVAILGVAFKGDTDDTRFTPSYAIGDALIKKGFEITFTDPFVKGKGIQSDLYSASEKSDCLVLVTDHSEYRKLDLVKLRKHMNTKPLIIDTRGIIDRKAAEDNGFAYHGLGRL